MEIEKLKEELSKLIQDQAVVKGRRKLASGKTADFYIDGRRVTLSAQGILLISKIINHMIHGLKIDAVGGPTLGADPIAAGVALISSQSGTPIKAFIVRKEAKNHGMQNMIEGPELEAGDRVVMVEDVVTTGGSVLQAIQEVEKTKAKVVRVISLVDREANGDEVLGAYNYTPIFTLSDLGLKP